MRDSVGLAIGFDVIYNPMCVLIVYHTCSLAYLFNLCCLCHVQRTGCVWSGLSHATATQLLTTFVGYIESRYVSQVSTSSVHACLNQSIPDAIHC